jgi:plastocyanin
VAATATAGSATAQSTPSSPFQVTNQGLNYFVDGIDGPTLTLRRGRTYVFEVSTPNHPFHISRDPNGGIGFPGVYETGVTVTDPDTEEDDATRTGTLTFSVPPNAPETLYYQCGVHQNMGGSIAVTDPPTARTFSVGNVGTNYYTIDGARQPPLELDRGRTYAFEVQASGHPFHISTDAAGGSFSGIYTDGVAVEDPSTANANSTETGRLLFTVPAGAPDTLYYQCGFHSGMGAELQISDGPASVRGNAPPTDGDGDGRYEDVNGNGRRDFDDVVSLFEGFEDDSVRSNADAYDFNGNGRLDFADIVSLLRDR